MSDGSEWLPPTLERVQAYIASQGSRRLARSSRRVVEQKARRGSKVAREYERDILKVDLKVSKQRGQRGDFAGYQIAYVAGKEQ